MISSTPRIRAAIFLALALLAALLWLNAVRVWQVPRPAPGDMIGAPAIRPDLAGALGVHLDAAELTADRLPALAAAGVRWVRFTLPWDAIEPTRGDWRWAPWDAAFAALARWPDITPLVVLDRSPAWARAADDTANPLAPPHERTDFGAFGRAVAARYGRQVRYYQIWHEPNIAPHWGARPADPAGYAGLLREAAVQVRAADADAQIVLAALAPTVESGPTNLSDITYLDALYRLGARRWFDIAAGQPFGFAQPPDAAPAPDRLNFGRAALLRAVMLRYGDAATPLWATAFGWNALPASWNGPPSPWGQVTPAEQARYGAGALELAATRWPWLGPLFWAAWRPPLPPDDPRSGFALCAGDGTPNPTGTALLAAAAQPPLLPPGDHAPDHPALRYSPGWRVTPDAADPSADGDTLTFTFWGAGLALRIQGGPYWAYYRVSVDDAPANALPRDEGGAAYLVLHDPLAETRVVPVARGLTPGPHTARIEAHGGWGQWALQGVLAEGAQPPAPPAPPAWLPWAGLAALATLLAGWAGWRFFVADTAPQNDRAVSKKIRARLQTLPDAVVLGTMLLLAGALLTVLHSLPLQMFALGGLGLLILWHPHLALLLIAASIPFIPAPLRLAGKEFSLYELLIWMAVARRVLGIGYWVLGIREWGFAGAAHSSRRPQSPIPNTRHSLDWPILALVAAALAATLAAERYGVALREFRTVFLDGALFYWLITRTPWPAGRRFSPWLLVGGLLGGMAAISALGLWQLVSGQGRIDVEGVWRVRALYGSPNNLALLLDRAVPLALALLAFDTSAPGSGDFSRPSLRRTAKAVTTRSLTFIVLFLTLAACSATFSKGALLLGLPAGIALVLLGGAWRTGRRWPLWTLGALAAAGALGLALLLQTPRFADLFNFQSGTSFFRVKLWAAAWQMAQAHPWLGVGPDNFLYAYRTHYVLPSAWQELNLSHPHNILLDLWTRLGLIGVAAGGWALVAVCTRAWRLFRSADAATWPLALGLLGGLAATVAHGAIDNSLFLVDLMALFALAAGVVKRISESANSE